MWSDLQICLTEYWALQIQAAIPILWSNDTSNTSVSQCCFYNPTYTYVFRNSLWAHNRNEKMLWSLINCGRNTHSGWFLPEVFQLGWLFLSSLSVRNEEDNDFWPLSNLGISSQRLANFNKTLGNNVKKKRERPFVSSKRGHGNEEASALKWKTAKRS